MNKELIKEKVLTALKIRKDIQEIYEKHKVLTVLCNESPNQYYNQVDENSEGIMVEYYYNTPSKIYTPLGYISITSGYLSLDENYLEAEKEIKEKFGFQLGKDSYQNSMGCFGPWYYITKLPWGDKIELKPYVTNRDKYIEYNEAGKLYDEILTEFNLKQ